MPAGNFNDGSYSTRVNQFDWVDFFDNYPLIIPQFALYLRKKFNYTLIDSRTGYSDISGICTSIMPEKLVTVFTPNRQSLSGVVGIIQQATGYRKQSDDLHPLKIYPLPSRIEDGEKKLQKIWRFGESKQKIVGYQKQMEAVLKEVYNLKQCDLTTYFDEFQLQYVPIYSYGEEIAILSERTEDRLSLARSFEDFTEKIISSKASWEDIKTPLERYKAEQKRQEAKTKEDNSRRTRIRAFLASLGLVIIFFSASLLWNNLNSTGEMTTFTPPPSATCAPYIQLSTPSGWATSSQLIVFLYDPFSVEDQPLELVSGETTQDISLFLSKTVPSVMGPRDQVVIFQLGYKNYEEARVIKLKQLLNRACFI